MNTLPIILGGGLLAFILMNRKAKSTTPSESITSKIGSKEVGYEIINCNKVIIYDENKAFEYAYSLAVNDALQNFNKDEYKISADPSILVGDCLEQFDDKVKYKTKEDALIGAKKFFKNKIVVKFIFNLLKYYGSGYASVDDTYTTAALTNANKMKDVFKDMGFDVTDLQTNLVIINPKK